MIMIRISKGRKDIIQKIVKKFQRNAKQGLMLGDIAYSDTAVYFMVPDEALSIAFVYGVYLKAREKNLNFDTMYATSIDLESMLPEDVKRVGASWISRRLSKEEIKLLKNKFITPNMLEAILK